MKLKKLSKVICNSSPIIGLCIIGKLDLLWNIYEEVIIPEAVYNEVVKSVDIEKIGAKELQKAVDDKNVTIYKVKDELLVNRFMGRLHRGELEVIAGAKELNLEYLLIDERSARALAEALMLEPTGTLGVLKFAKMAGYIDELKIYLDCLMENNYRISKKIYSEILASVGEF